MNQKVPRERRHTLLLAETANKDIFWVEGLRISEHFKLTAYTRRRLPRRTKLDTWLVNVNSHDN